MALETGSVDGAFQANAQSALNKGFESYDPMKTNLPPWTPSYSEAPPTQAKPYAHNPVYNSNSVNRIVDNIQRGNGVLSTDNNNTLYKPKIPTGWSTNIQSSQSNMESYGK